MCLPLSLDIGWDCQWASPKGKWFKTKTHSASRICREYQLCLLQNVHGWWWLAFLVSVGGYRSNLSSFQVTFKSPGTSAPIIRVLPQRGRVPTSAGVQEQPFLQGPTLFEIYFSKMCTFNQHLPRLSTMVSFEKSKSLNAPTSLFLCNFHSRLNFILSSSHVACLNPWRELQIVYSVKR